MSLSWRDSIEFIQTKSSFTFMSPIKLKIKAFDSDLGLNWPGSCFQKTFGPRLWRRGTHSLFLLYLFCFLLTLARGCTMALRAAILRSGNPSIPLGTWRWAHSFARPPLFDALVSPPPVPSPSFVLPEFDRTPERNDIGSPSFGAGGSMELMAAPKKKVPYISFDGFDCFEVLLGFWWTLATIFFSWIFSIGFYFFGCHY